MTTITRRIGVSGCAKNWFRIRIWSCSLSHQCNVRVTITIKVCNMQCDRYKRKKTNYSKVFCSLRNAPSFSCGWPGLLISVRRVILRMMKISSRWHLRAEAKKRFSVDTELAPPFLTQVQTLLKDLFIKIYPNIGQIMINTQDEPQKIIY